MMKSFIAYIIVAGLFFAFYSPKTEATLSNQIRMPAGTVLITAASSCPAFTVAADGTLYPNASTNNIYQNLATAIGTTYGGVGGTSFNVPNTQAVYIRGAGSQTIGGIAYSATLAAASTDAIQRHNHTDSGHTHVESSGTSAGGSNVFSFSSGSGNVAIANVTQSGTANLGDPTNSGTGGGAPRLSTETKPATLVLKYCIWY